VLWPDTFNNHFTPRTAQAAVEVLEAAGYSVRLPAGNVCSGRPLYDYGMRDLAKHKLRETMHTLRPVLNRGLSLVVLEPSCASLFRDEVPNLLPHDQDALRLSAL